MHDPKQSTRQVIQFLVLALACAVSWPSPARCQDSSAESNLARGDRGELSVTVRDSSGEPISAPAMIKIYRSGVPTDQGAARKGRAFFILNALGDYTIVVDAPGYQTSQREVSMPVALKAEVDIYLRRDSDKEGGSAVPGKPLLAPKAKESFDKALQALREDKLKDAEKYVGEAMKLAPGHPDVLYVQGVVYLKQHKFEQAQSVLEKATQIYPNHARAFAALGMTLSNEGRYDVAIAPLEKSLQLEAGSWETRWTLAKAYYQHQQYDQALKASQEALAGSNGKAPEIELLVAQSLTAVGRYEDSAEILREFLRNHGDRPETATARRYLQRLTADGKIRKD